MIHRINPRTGAIGDLHGLRALERHGAQSRSKRASHPSQLPSSFDPQALLAMAQEIGRTIARELQRLPVQYAPVTKGSHFGQTEMRTTATVELDESLIDVGIGDIEELQKGSESGNLAQERTTNDAELSSSKDKLRALKRGKEHA